jgi:hypothetical protein
LNVFQFSWRDHRETYERKAWVHIRDGVAPEFLDAAREFVSAAAGDRPLSGDGIKGAKGQHLFEFPDSVHYASELLDVLGPLTGLKPANMTLSERHIKAYDGDADPRPAPHKDRLSSQIAVGVSLEVPPRSHLVLYPHDDRETNPLLSTGLRERLEPDELPEVTLRDARGVEIYDAPGDVIVFPGSSMWHLRRNSAGTVNIYLKFNDFDSDPLGEDPTTAKRRAATLAALDGGPDALAGTVPVLSRRFDSVAREHSRHGWRESLWARIWGQPPLHLSETEYALLRSLGGAASFSSATSGDHGVDAAETDGAIRRLAHRGAVDLLPRHPQGKQVTGLKESDVASTEVPDRMGRLHSGTRLISNK